MAKNIKKPIQNFSTRIEVRGENADVVRMVLERKMKEDKRRSYTNTIEALIIEFGEQKGWTI